MDNKWLANVGTNYGDLVTKMSQHKLYVAALSLVALFGWEHSCRMRNVAIRPTVGINYVTKQLRFGFKFIGECLAHVSSFLTLLDFSEMKKTGSDMVNSGLNFSTSFFYILKGYYDQAKTYTGDRILVYLGTFLLLVSYRYHVGMLVQKYIQSK